MSAFGERANAANVHKVGGSGHCVAILSKWQLATNSSRSPTHV